MSLWVTNGFGRFTTWILLSALSPLPFWPPTLTVDFFLFLFFLSCSVHTSFQPTSPLSFFTFQLFFNAYLKTINYSSLHCPLTAGLYIPIFLFLLSKFHLPQYLGSLPVYLQQPLSLCQSPSLFLCLPARCESVLVLTGSAMCGSAKCSGAVGQNI